MPSDEHGQAGAERRIGANHPLRVCRIERTWPRLVGKDLEKALRCNCAAPGWQRLLINFGAPRVAVQRIVHDTRALRKSLSLRTIPVHPCASLFICVSACLFHQASRRTHCWERRSRSDRDPVIDMH